MDSLMGFRFKPTDEEIIDLLKQKRLDPKFSVPTIKELDIYKFDPWELPGFCEIQSKEEVWYFFCEPYYKYAKSKRVHRRTERGYYKVTGRGSKPKVKNSCKVIGTKKILTFCSNSNSGFEKANTKWVMHEIAIGDDPLYKKDFVVCRLERKRVTKLGNSTRDEDQQSQELAYCSSSDVTEVISSEFDLPLDQPMVSNRNHVAENIFSKTDSQSRNHVAENTVLDYEVLASDHLISYTRNHVAENTSLESILPPPNQHLVSNRNHVAENTCAESQVLPSDSLVFSYARNLVAEITAAESQLLASQNVASYSRNHIAEVASPEWQQPENPTSISYSRNHVAENASLEYMLPPPNQQLVSNRNHVAENTWTEPEVLPSHGLVSSYSRNHVAEITAAEYQLLASQNLASFSRNHIAEIASPEWQQPANHTSISYSRNHVVENSSLEYMLPPPNQQLVSNRNHVAENTWTEPQVLPSHGLVSSYSRNHVAEITAAESQLATQNLASYSRNVVAEIAFPEWQQLANHTSISYSRNHVAENASAELQIVPNDNLESLILPNQQSGFYSTNFVECTFAAGPRPLPEFNPHSGCNGLINASFPALESLIYPQQESLYSNYSSYDFDLLNSQFTVIREMT